jgi:hydrogenase/urease accessory protein HupE
MLGLAAAGADAHEVRPAYLELRQTDAESYDASWKVPGRGENLRLALYVELPRACANAHEPRTTFAGGALTERWGFVCVGGLAGGTIHIAGLRATSTDVLVRIERQDGSAQITRLTPDAPSFVVARAPQAFDVAGTYVALGVEHIVTGIDHLLFVLALLLLVDGVGRLVATVTAFNVAHSVTLGASALGLVGVPAAAVEATIALSILFLATELARAGRRAAAGAAATSPQADLTRRFPWLVAFAFGLLHGFGFAGALREIGLPPDAIPLALLFFNIGVEVGQLVFIACLLGLAAVWRRTAAPLPAAWPRVAAYAIGTIAAYWTIERTAAVLS